MTLQRPGSVLVERSRVNVDRTIEEDDLSEVTAYDPGTPSYIDLATSDLDAAKSFYTAMFGWDTEDSPLPQGGVYTSFSKNSRTVAGGYTMNPQMANMGVPPHWATYVTVANADAAAEAITAAGGSLITQPFDVMTAGRMAVATDPRGATFSVWQPIESIGAYLVNEPGALIWNELQTNDRTASKEFYGAIFGWSAQTSEMPTGEYTSFMLGESPVAGMMEIQPEWGPVPPNWSIYLAVANCDAAIDKATSLGGSTVMGPMDVPDVGRFALLQDPQGAMFYVMSAPDDG